MKHWQTSVAVEANPNLPVFQRIAKSIADDIRRGRLRPGASVPGSRSLAESLGVHRNTVLAAYRELQAEGWLETRPGGGTYVSLALPAAPARPFATLRGGVPTQVGFDIGPTSEVPSPPPFAPGTLVLAGGVPDLTRVPTAALARAYRSALQRHSPALLAYGDPRGEPRLRAALAEMLSALRGLATTADEVFVTRGSQMALDLVARTLVSPGDVVVVEALGYRPAWAALRGAGAELVPLPVDASGLRTDALAALVARSAERRIRAVYVTPHHQYPTTVTLSAARRLELLSLAREHRIAVVEDDYDNEFHYEGRPVLPLASADTAGVVLYLGTLSKVLAPGLRIGFVVAPAPLLDRLAELRMRVDRQGDLVMERAVAELLEDGEVQRHARRMRRLYAARRAALVTALRTGLGDILSFTVPAGGMALWAHVTDPAIDVEAWAERARSLGVGLHTGRRFTFDGRALPCLRLGFAALDESDLQEAVRRMARAL